MHLWLVTVGEPLPGSSGGSRLWRTGMLAQELVRRGHEVTWWTSRFDHFRKIFFGPPDSSTWPLTIRFLEGCAYRRNVSFARLLNHCQIARDFRNRSRATAAPAIILCSFPTIELAAQAVSYGREVGVPVVLDVRDLWPDVFVDVVTPRARWLPRLALAPYFKATRAAFRNASAVVAVSRGYLDWGLRHAGRAQRAADQVFPLGYEFPDADVPSRSQAHEMLSGFGIQPGRITCLFAGTFGRTYDLEPVLHTATRLAARGDDRFQFVICGDGERAAHWRARAAGLAQVIFTGWLEQRLMRAALVASDIGLAAYAAGAPQGIPNKVIEYLAAALPVVSSLAGESEALLREHQCGRSYDPNRPESLLDALIFLSDPLVQKRFARSARTTFDAHFRAECVYARLADHLEHI